MVASFAFAGPVEEALASGATPTLDGVDLEPVQVESAAAFAG